MVSPAVLKDGTAPRAPWSAPCGGVLLIRLGRSATLRFRWRMAQAVMAVGAAPPARP